ncbi:MAG: fluoride efflux transporter CrcB [Saprospiraceae bacterium]
MNIQAMILVFVGGGLGSLVRYLLSIWLNQLKYFYLGTLLANIIAAFLIGLFLYNYEIQPDKHWIKFFLTVGFCGGLSTFSAFSNENLSLIQQSRYLELIIYIVLSIILGIIACLLGYKWANGSLF